MSIIILNLKKSNRKLEETIAMYQNMLNFGFLECPKCQAHEFIRWGTYKRNVICFNENNQLTSHLITIQRVRCKECKMTHAILPFGVIPYKQFADEVISKILYESCQKTVERLAITYQLELSIIKKWKHQFKKKYLAKLSTLIGEHKKEDILRSYIKEDTYKEEYIKQNRECFMQIKIGRLGLNSS